MAWKSDKAILKAATSIAFYQDTKSLQIYVSYIPIRLLMVPYVREAALGDKVSWSYLWGYKAL